MWRSRRVVVSDSTFKGPEWNALMDTLKDFEESSRNAYPALLGGPNYGAQQWHQTTVTTTHRRPSVQCKGCGAQAVDVCEYCGRRV